MGTKTHKLQQIMCKKVEIKGKKHEEIEVRKEQEQKK